MPGVVGVGFHQALVAIMVYAWCGGRWIPSSIGSHHGLCLNHDGYPPIN